jgi:NADH-quinone oxidoreductase subunit M
VIPALARVWLALACTLATWIAGAPAIAAPADPAGRIELSVGGKPGPLDLGPGQGGWVGELTITNVGGEPLAVSRIAIRGDDEDVRSPAHVSARFMDGAATSAVIGPGGSKNVQVTWMPDREPRVRQAFGHVLITSSDERAGEVAMGFRAELPTGLGVLGSHVLAVLWLAPLAIVLVAAGVWAAGRRETDILGRFAAGVYATRCLLGAWAYLQFTPDVTRADGNDGFQLIERSVWVRAVGAEWFVGVDGASMPLLLMATGVALVAGVFALTERRSAMVHAALALLSIGVTGALVALDLVLVYASWQLVWIALMLLVGNTRPPPRAYPASGKLAMAAITCGAAMLLGFVALSRASNPTFLSDGTSVAHTLAIPELSRVSFAARPPIAGIPFVELSWGFVFVAAAIATPLVPFHGWFADTLEQCQASTAMALAGIVVALGPYTLLRVGLCALPEGARWAGASMAALGALGAGWGSLCAMVQRDLRRFVAYTTIASSGSCLYGLGSLTSEGLAGALATLVAHALSSLLLLGLASALEERAGTCDAVRAGGLARDSAALATCAAVGLGVSMGAPGLAGAWGPLLTILGGFSRYPGLSLVLAAAWVAAAVAHIRMARLLLLGDVDPRWRSAALLKPYGGRLPGATSPELFAWVPVVALAIAIGSWPGPLLSVIGVTARDIVSLVDPDAPDR